MPIPLARILLDIKVAQHDIETHIMATPTGEKRNKLTDVNILLMEIKMILESLS